MRTRPFFLRLTSNLLASGLLLCGAAFAAHAQTVITSLPYNISSPGTYVLNSNLNGTQTSGNLISVSASNVTIDFQGHYIAGPVGVTGQTTFGVSAVEQSNITIKNGTVAYCYEGIYIEGNGSATTNSVSHRIDNMRATYCYLSGIYIKSGPATRITNCQVSQTGYNGANDAYGIIGFGAGTTISGCVVSSVNATNPYGIYASPGSFVRRNTVSNSGFGVYGGKYQDNLTANCLIAYSNGTDAGGNN